MKILCDNFILSEVVLNFIKKIIKACEVLLLVKFTGFLDSREGFVPASLIYLELFRSLLMFFITAIALSVQSGFILHIQL